MAAEGASVEASLQAVGHANSRAGNAAYESIVIDANGLPTHAVVAGQGEPLIFLHGFPSFWYCWIRLLEPLRHRYRVIAVDALGAGATAKSTNGQSYAVASLMDWLGNVIEQVTNGQKPVLIGHDWGAALSFTFAQHHPSRLGGVVGIAAPPYGMFRQLLASDSDQQARSRYMEKLRTMTTDEAGRVAAEVARAAYAGLVERDVIGRTEYDLFVAACGDPLAFAGGCAWYAANLGDDAPAFAGPAAPLQIPSALVWGEADETFVPRVPAQFKRDNPDAIITCLPGVGHWCMLEAPEPCSETIEAVAASASAGRERLC